MSKNKERPVKSTRLEARRSTGQSIDKHAKITKESMSKRQLADVIEIAKTSTSYYDLYRKVKANKSLKVEFLYLSGVIDKTQLRLLVKIDQLGLAESELRTPVETYDEPVQQVQVLKSLATHYIYVYSDKNTFNYLESLELPGILKRIEYPISINQNSVSLLFLTGDPDIRGELVEVIKRNHLKFITFDTKNVLSIKRSDFIRRLNDVWKKE